MVACRWAWSGCGGSTCRSKFENRGVGPNPIWFTRRSARSAGSCISRRPGRSPPGTMGRRGRRRRATQALLHWLRRGRRGPAAGEGQGGDDCERTSWQVSISRWPALLAWRLRADRPHRGMSRHLGRCGEDAPHPPSPTMRRGEGGDYLPALPAWQAGDHRAVTAARQAAIWRTRLSRGAAARRALTALGVVGLGLGKVAALAQCAAGVGVGDPGAELGVGVVGASRARLGKGAPRASPGATRRWPGGAEMGARLSPKSGISLSL